MATEHDTRDWRGHCPKCGKYPAGDHDCTKTWIPTECVLCGQKLRKGEVDVCQPCVDEPEDSDGD